ncbi:hypothetical protein BGZ60DRAFT_432276 [Tricladium varicosporioides]|nr:hypothetical protein BGZ60DRAFT_432276 [Hymenoscyphus varicosporioides]
MLFRYLVIEALGVTVVLARGSEIDAGAQLPLNGARAGIQLDASKYLGADSNGSSSCHAHKHDTTTLLFSDHKHHDHSHPHIFDNLQTCPKVATELTPWPAGMSNRWTHVPRCTKIPDLDSTSNAGDQISPFCLFTSTEYRAGRGISIVSKPEIAREISNLPAFNINAPDPTQDQPPPYEIKYVVGKGMGVIANRTIQRGERLFAHSVIAIYSNEAFLTRWSKEYGLRTKLMEEGVEQLPAESARLFHAMIGQHDAFNDVIGKLNVNTFGEEFGGEDHSIVVPETARMNHDCRPNAMYYFDRQTLVHYTQASRTINAGEEITITYIDPLQSREDRRAAIVRSWGFDCTCSLCISPPTISDASDGRVSAINRLVELLRGVKYRQGEKEGIPAEEELGMVETLMSLYEQERLYAHIADAYVYAARAYKRAGKLWDALRLGYKAEEAALIYDGPRHIAVSTMEGLIEEVEEELKLVVEEDESEEA